MRPWAWPPWFSTVGGIVLFVLVVWLLYVTVKVAQHVSAWPF